MEDVVALLRLGQSNRRTGETNMNERSSRSHRWAGEERNGVGGLQSGLKQGACWLGSSVMAYADVAVLPMPTSPCLVTCCSVFTCKLQSKTMDQYGTSHVRTSRLHLVDLAGGAGTLENVGH